MSQPETPQQQEDIDYNNYNEKNGDEINDNNEEQDNNNNQENNEQEYQQDGQQQQEGDEDQNNEQQQQNINEQYDQQQQGDDQQQQDQDQQQNQNQQNQELEQEDEQGEQNEIDIRSVYVQNVDYQSTQDDIIEHFKDVGQIRRVTILKDKYTQQPKGGAYIEFDNIDSVEIAKGLTDSSLRGRQIKVVPKRTNIPNFGNRRGRGGRGGGIRRGGPTMGGFNPYMRGNYMYQQYRGRGMPRGGRGRGGYAGPF